MATNDKYSLILVANMDKVAIANTFFINVLDDSGTADTAESIASAFQAEFVTLLKANQTSQLEYECMLIRKVAPKSEPAVMYTLSDVGALAATGLPTNQTLCLNTVSGDGTAPYRGRWFISGLLESQVEDGTFTSAIEALFVDFLNAIKSSFGITGELFQLHHFSKHEGNYTPITRGRLDAVPRKLRGRTPGLCSIS
tara:strand:- start:353 stop:943 length:591 start_codon:yes stop_codon:yes gene_type:complete